MQESGQITEEVFSSMLASYLSQIGDVKKTARKKKQPQVGLIVPESEISLYFASISLI